MKYLILGLLGAVLAGVAPGKQTFIGTITDDMCAVGHAQMRMGPTMPECTVACIQGRRRDLRSVRRKNTYMLSDQKTPEKFAGQKVKVVGTVDTKTKTIQVESIAAAK